MRKEVNRYTLNLVVGDEFTSLPFALSTLENIDRATTHFNNVPELANFLNMFMLIDEDIHNLTITYNANKQVRYLPLIFKDMRSIFDDKNLNNKIITYLSRYSIVSSLKIEEIKNKYIRDLLYSLLEQKTLNDYNFRLEKINKHLTNEYKLKRDLVLFLNKEMERKGNTPIVVTSHNNEENTEEIVSCFDKMNITYIPSIYVSENKQFSFLLPDTGDGHLNALIAAGDYDAISRTYDLDTLESLGVGYLFDGGHAMIKKRSKIKK